MNPQDIDRTYHEFRKRNLFWPVVLILAGLVLLLENLGLLPALTLARLWPVLLIIWGLDLFWRRYHEFLHK